MTTITMYVTGWCPYCQRAGELLTKKGLTFNQINVDDDAKFREEMIARSGRRTVPQIFINDKPIGGCDDLVALEARGELDRLVSISVEGSINSGQG
jgi:glutaredoxin 3